MGAATINADPAVRAACPEVYALSMETLRRLGELAYGGASREALIAAGLAYADFTTGVAENLKTDKELSHLLDVARTYEFEVKDGQAVSADGTPMVDVVRRGYEQSRAEASADPRKAVQAERDKGDLLVAEAVDSLSPGESYAVLSMCPEDAFARGINMESLGYVPGMSFVQVFVRIHDKVIVHCLSVEASSKPAWHDVLGQFGLDVPAETSANEWIRYGLRSRLPIQDALGLAGRVRETYYQHIGQVHRRYSATDFLRQHDGDVQRYFNMYVRPLAEAIYTAQNNETMQGLARVLMDAGVGESFNEDEMKIELGRIAHGEPGFTAASGRTMERLIRYALVEDLRARLVSEMPDSGHDWSETTPTQHDAAMNSVDIAAMHTQLAGHIQAGIRAQRTYGGCSGLRFIGSGSEEHGAAGGNPQEPYGGRAQSNERQESSDEACDYWIDGCYCSGYKVDGTPSDTKVVVKVRRDPDGKAHCLRAGCGACLGPNGEVINIGGIARRARQLERQHARQKPVGARALSGLLSS